MLVDGGEGKEEGAIENLAEIRYAVEDGDEVAKACDEADDELSEDGFGDILARSGKPVSKYWSDLVPFRGLTGESPLQGG